ncbi:hypothetical protein CS063_00735 [Sporanaerobium hydrogeniformans]|uniref:Uncharacterized protein n=1 Tax=Sporanaerobium hydrogeniformans TaxID=3072179 RepID=A0AC61DHH3_9FIRM|nr:DUF1540 domain-containing protein [Sporanaerobium hydrogeniformans]PHV72036.1 hypothetical protein CS063_00735 [Sporanaerobium hydrogeniformans]
MPLLRCDVDNCVHNGQNCCELGQIAVKGRSAQNASETCCSTFCECTGSMSNACIDINPQAEVQIKCSAQNCTHNENFYCNARDINVCGCGASSAEYTSCSSFHMR